MALTRRVALTYNHVQDTASTTWTIVHGLQDYPIVDVYITLAGELQKVLPQAVTYVNPTTCVVTFSEAVSGYASVI